MLRVVIERAIANVACEVGRILRGIYLKGSRSSPVSKHYLPRSVFTKVVEVVGSPHIPLNSEDGLP